MKIRNAIIYAFCQCIAFVACAGTYAVPGTNIILSFGISSGEAIILDCNTDATGDLEIPGTLYGAPVTRIGQRAFYYCRELTTVNIPSGVTSIDDSAFGICNSMTDVAIPRSVTAIGDRAFEHCSALSSITIPESVETIGAKAFDGCDALIEIFLSKNISFIGEGAFGFCENLVRIEVDHENSKYRSLDCILFNKDSTTLHTFPCGRDVNSYTIPDGVAAINSYAFFGNQFLHEVRIANSVISVGVDAFSFCGSLIEVFIPSSVTEMGTKRFNTSSDLAFGHSPRVDSPDPLYDKKGCHSVSHFETTWPHPVRSVPASADI